MTKLNKLIKRCRTEWKLRNLVKKELNSETVYGDRYIKNKIKLNNNKKNSNFHDDEIPEEDVFCVCLSLMSLKLVDKVGENIISKHC